VAQRDLKIGEKLQKEDIAFKRAPDGAFPSQINDILGKSIKKEIKKDSSIKIEDLE
jgi:sialic acid synthase SpsE